MAIGSSFFEENENGINFRFVAGKAHFQCLLRASGPDTLTSSDITRSIPYSAVDKSRKMS
eukprot:scaffold52196_cov72-Cyclotella_meneghiniana.AAC.1